MLVATDTKINMNHIIIKCMCANFGSLVNIILFINMPD